MSPKSYTVTTRIRETPRIATVPQSSFRPNILIVILDDVGIECLQQYQAYALARGIYSAVPAWPSTPNIASLAQSGVKFTNARACPNCSPFRAQLHSGRYAFRTGIGTVVRENNVGAGVDEYNGQSGLSEVSIPSMVVPRGYDSCIVGKYHLANPDQNDWAGSPPASGVYGSGWAHARNQGWRSARISFRNLSSTPKPEGISAGDANDPGYWNYYWYEDDGGGGTVEQIDGTYHTIHARRRAEDWILNEAKEPWICYLALSAPHSPWGNFPTNGAGNSGCMPPAPIVSTPGYDANSIWGSFRAAIEGADNQIGLLLNNIGSIADRTIKIVVGDNGTDQLVLGDALSAGEPFTASYQSLINAGGRFKSTIYEGGVRVPLIVSGPAPLVRNGGRTSNVLVDAGVDTYAMIRHAAGVGLAEVIPDNRKVDGISYLPILQNAEAEATHPRTQSLVEYFVPNGIPSSAQHQAVATVRDRGFCMQRDDGLYKLVRRLGASDELYRLEDQNGTAIDPYEQSPLDISVGGAYRTAYEEVAAALQALLQS